MNGIAESAGIESHGLRNVISASDLTDDSDAALQAAACLATPRRAVFIYSTASPGPSSRTGRGWWNLRRRESPFFVICTNFSPFRDSRSGFVPVHPFSDSAAHRAQNREIQRDGAEGSHRDPGGSWLAGIEWLGIERGRRSDHAGRP